MIFLILSVPKHQARLKFRLLEIDRSCFAHSLHLIVFTNTWPFLFSFSTISNQLKSHFKTVPLVAFLCDGDFSTAAILHARLRSRQFCFRLRLCFFETLLTSTFHARADHRQVRKLEKIKGKRKSFCFILVCI